VAFATKYQAKFRDDGDAAWTINFQYDGFSGSITEFACGPIPVTIHYNANDKYDPIVTSAADIQLVYESAVDALFVEANQAVKVVIFSSYSEWNGFLVPNQYFRMYGGNTQVVTFTATDQLRLLENIKFEDGSGDPYYYLEDDLSVISTIIRNGAASAESMRESVNIYEDNFDATAADSPLDQTFFSQEMYWDIENDQRGNMWDVLTDIVKKYGARLFYHGNLWHLQRPNSMWAKRVVRLFTSDPMAYSLNYGAIENKWNRVDQYGVWLMDTHLEKYPRAGRVEVTANPGRKKNLVRNSTFDDFTQSASYPRYWTDDATVTVSDGYVTIGGNGSSSDPNQGMYTDFDVNELAGGNIILDIEPTYSGGTNCTLHFALSNTAENRWARMQGYTGDNPDWVATEVHYELDVVAEGLNDIRFILTIPMMPDYLNPSQDYRLHIFEVMDGGDTTASVKVYNVQFQPIYGQNVPESEVQVKTNSVTSNSLITSEIRMCDAFKYRTWGMGMYWILRHDTGINDNTSSWFIKGDAATETTGVYIQELLAKQIIEGYDQPTDIIHGTLRYDVSQGTYYPYSSVLVEDTITDAYGYAKCFLPLSISWDLINMQCRGDWIEVSPKYTDEEIEWASETYATAGIVGNEIDMNETVSGTMTATSDAFTAIAYENFRVKVGVVDAGSSEPPNYSIDGQTGTLAFGTNYLQFMMATAGSKTFQINHTNGERANCVITIYVYRLTGL